MQMTLFATKYRVRNNRLMATVVRLAMANLKSARIKDLAAISYAIIYLDYQSPHGHELAFMQAALAELRNRRDECQDFRDSFIACQCYWAMRNVHDCELLATALTPVPIDAGRKNEEAYTDGNLLFLDSYARLNVGLDVYKGPLLSDEQRIEMQQRFDDGLDKKMLPLLADAVREKFGHCHLARAMPHFIRDGEQLYFLHLSCAVVTDFRTFFADIFVAFDLDKRIIVDKSQKFLSESPGKILYSHMLAEDDEKLHVWAFVVGGWQHSILTDEESIEYSRILKFKMEQLALLGFKPHLVGIHANRKIYHTLARYLDRQ